MLFVLKMYTTALENASWKTPATTSYPAGTQGRLAVRKGSNALHDQELDAIVVVEENASSNSSPESLNIIRVS